MHYTVVPVCTATSGLHQHWFYAGCINDVLKKNVPVEFAATRALLISYLNSNAMSEDPGGAEIG
jgi:hypothetical protein